MGNDTHPKDDSPPRQPPNVGPVETPDLPPGGGPIFDSSGKLTGGAGFGPHGEGEHKSEKETTSTTHDGGVAAANEEALGFLRQALDNLAESYSSDYTTREIAVRIMSVYTMANNVARGSGDWDSGLHAEFDAWLPYEVDSGARKEYNEALSAVHFAGEALYSDALAWEKANPNRRLTGAIPSLARHLHGVGAPWRAAIDAAHGRIASANHEALELVRQAINDLTGATDAEIIVRNAGTALSMVNNLLRAGGDWEPALADEYREWVSLTPTDAAVTAKDNLVAAVESVYDSAVQWSGWYPCFSLREWTDAPVRDLIQATTTARTTIATP